MDFKAFLLKTIFLAITAIIIYIIKIIFKKIIKGIFLKKELKKPEKKKRFHHFEKLIMTAINLAYIIVMALIVLEYTGLNSVFTALITFAGVGSLVVGLAAQDIFKDIIAGFLLISEDNISHDDFVQINGYEGTVEEIRLRNIYLRTYSGQLVAIPSGEVETVVNYSRGRAKALCYINIPSLQQVEKAYCAVSQAGEKLKKDFSEILSSAVIDGIVEIKDSSYRLRAYVEANGTDYFFAQRKFNEYIINELQIANIPFIVESKYNVRIENDK